MRNNLAHTLAKYNVNVSMTIYTVELLVGVRHLSMTDYHSEQNLSFNDINAASNTRSFTIKATSLLFLLNDTNVKKIDIFLYMWEP